MVKKKRILLFYCGMYVPLSDDKHRFVRDNSLWSLRGRNCDPVATLLHTAVVFHMRPFSSILVFYVLMNVNGVL